MRATWQGLIQYPTADYDDNEPVDTLRSIQLLSNTQFQADRSAQHRVNWVARAGNYQSTTCDQNVWTFVRRFGPVPWQRYSEGDGYQQRVNVLGTGTDGAKNFELRVIFSPLGVNPVYLAVTNEATSGPFVEFTALTGSTTMRWVSTVSAYDVLADDDLQALAKTRRFRALDTQITELNVYLYALCSSSGGGTWRTAGLHVSEYVAP